MTIRQYAKENGHEIIGKLTRNAEAEHGTTVRYYFDEAFNEYWVERKNGKTSICIVTAEGMVI